MLKRQNGSCITLGHVLSLVWLNRGVWFSALSAKHFYPTTENYFFKLCCKGFYNYLFLLSQQFLAAPVTLCRTMRSFQQLSKSYSCTLKQ